MRRLHFANTQLTVPNVVCRSVLRYARALARAGSTEVVTVPIRLGSGKRSEAYLVLGPASQLMSTPNEDEADDRAGSDASITDLHYARRLERSITRLHSSPLEPVHVAGSPVDLDFEY